MTIDGASVESRWRPPPSVPGLIALRGTGLLGRFAEAGLLDLADVHVARALGRLGGEPAEPVLLAAAFAVRAVRLGSVCVDLARVQETATAEGLASSDEVDVAAVLGAASDTLALAWPHPTEWVRACASSGLVSTGPVGPADRPLRLVGGLLYLDRYWRAEQQVRAFLLARAAQPLPAVDLGRLDRALAAYFPLPDDREQSLAAAAAALGWVTVVAGGPGTGKTTTIARLLGVLGAVADRPPRVALAAPTGKAAARLGEAVTAAAADLADRGLPLPPIQPPMTLHRLLGWRPESQTRFRHDRDNPLPFDVVVIDETSMVSLTLMARLLDAVRPHARLVLVGDPDQLVSVEAGAVLGDLVHRPARSNDDRRLAMLRRLRSRVDVPGAEASTVELRGELGGELGTETVAELRRDVVRLRHTFRFGGSIAAIAEATRRGDADEVVALLRGADETVEFCDFDVAAAAADRVLPPDLESAALDSLRTDLVTAARALRRAALDGRADAALTLVNSHRLLCAHRTGPFGVERWSAQVERHLGAAIEGYRGAREWFPGRPLLVVQNDYELGLFNGDTGVVVDDPAQGLVAAFDRDGEIRYVGPSRLGRVVSVYAMTVHRSQGSEFERVSLLLPPPGSPLLTRELFYTGVTRARRFLRVIGSEAAVRAAVTRSATRASGLRQDLG